jgi:uncharacterized repeat protein (TIGR02543 family)
MAIFMENKITNKRLRNENLTKTLFAILLATVMMVSLLPATFATDTTNIGTTDNSDKVVTKAKAATIKVTWNGNGGKIGTKKTTFTSIKKGAKIKKLPTTPKRVGYAFKGWYTKKSGGTKVTTKTKPKKKITYYAQWTTKPSNSTNSKLIGHWQYKGLSGYASAPVSYQYYYYDYYFYNDGKFKYFYQSPTYLKSSNMYSNIITITEGEYKISNGKIYFSEILYERGNPIYEKNYNDTVFEYKFDKDTVGEYLFMPSFQYDKPYLDISWGVKFRKI